MKIQQFLKSKKQSGYTIIETMIAISLFLVVIMYGTTALLNVNLLHKKSQDMRSIMDNLSFIMEEMSRNIRVGFNYHCVASVGESTTSDYLSTTKSCESGYAIVFEHSTDANILDEDNQWVYAALEFTENGQTIGSLWKATRGPYNSLGNFVRLTPEEVDLNLDLTPSVFSVLGAESLSENDKQQPFVTIRLVGTITTNNVVTPFSLQTSVSQRLVDNY